MDRSVVAYLLSYGLSTLGNAVAAVVLPLVVLLTTGSALAAGTVAAATAVPAVLAGLFMGTLIDRFDRRTMSVVTDVVSALAIAALPLVELTVGLSVGWFVLFGVLGSFGDVPGLTARETLLPGVQRRSGVPLERLMGIREGLAAVVLMAGPAGAALLVVLLDAVGALWVTAALALAAALTTLLLPREVGAVPAAPAQRGGGVLADLRVGWTWLARGSSVVLAVTLLNLVMVTVVAALQGLLLPVHFVALGQEGRLGLVLSAIAAGMLAGSATYAALGRRLSRRRWLRIGLVGSLVGIGLVVALPPVGWVLAGAAVFGVFGGLLGSLLGVMMIELIPDDLRGRVMSTQNAVLTLAPSLGMLGAGVLVDRASAGTAGAVLGVLWAVAVLLALVAGPLRRLDAATS